MEINHRREQNVCLKFNKLFLGSTLLPFRNDELAVPFRSNKRPERCGEPKVLYVFVIRVIQFHVVSHADLLLLLWTDMDGLDVAGHHVLVVAIMIDLILLHVHQVED